METIFTGKNFKITTDESGEYKMEWDWKNIREEQAAKDKPQPNNSDEQLTA